MTFLATLEAVTQAGATPVPVDVGDSDHNIDPARRRERRHEATRAIMPVHLYGQLADMSSIGAIAGRHERRRDRGRVPGARRVARRCGRRVGGSGGGVQLLPWQEPRCIRRRRRVRLRRRGARDTRSGASRARPDREVPSRRNRLHRSPRHRSGARACCGSCRCSTAGTRSGSSRPRATPSCSMESVTFGFHRFPTAAIPCGTSTSSGPTRRSLSGIPPTAASRRQALPGARAPRPRPTLTSATRRAASRSPKRICREALSLPMFPGISDGQQTHVVGAIEEYFRRG